MGWGSKIKAGIKSGISGVKSLFGSGSSSSSSSTSPPPPPPPPPPSAPAPPSVPAPAPPPSSPDLGYFTNPSSEEMKSPKLNKPAKTLKDITKILGGGSNRRGKHHNRPGSGTFGGFGGGSRGSKHMGKKDNMIMGIIIGLIGIVIISLVFAAIISKLRKARAAAAEKAKRDGVVNAFNRNKEVQDQSQDLESGDCSIMNQQSGDTNDSSVGVAYSTQSYNDEKLNFIDVGGDDLMPPGGFWGQSDPTLSMETAAAMSGSVGCSNCAQNGSTGCESCAGGSDSQTPVPEGTLDQTWVRNNAAVETAIPEFAPSSPMTVVIPSVLPEVQISTSTFVDAPENINIGVADSGLTDVPATGYTETGTNTINIETPSLDLRPSEDFNAESILNIS
ncbi:hypothetical protein TWF506_010718 [Arthrobotrys conoides]|uniref:Uncharacterized protein n=1 Tax=Arthrobotrys conoides TaxID=74498 RepID=A0AAN8RL64_9PEZI